MKSEHTGNGKATLTVLANLVSCFFFCISLFILAPNDPYFRMEDFSFSAALGWLGIPVLCIVLHWLAFRLLKVENAGLIKKWIRFDIGLMLGLCLLYTHCFAELFSNIEEVSVISAIVTGAVALFVAERLLCAKKPQHTEEQE